MNIRVSIDTRELDKMCERLKRQIPFASMLAINATAERVKKAEVAHIKKRFTVRKSSVLKDVRFEKSDRATKSNLVATVKLEGPRQKESIFTKFEKGGSITAPHNKPFAIPTDELRPSKSTVIPRRFYPTNLRLVDRKSIDGGILRARKHTTKRGVFQLKGKLRSFVIDPAHHRYQHWVVMQREGKDAIRMLWGLRSRIRVPRKLRFYDTARIEIRKAWPEEFKKAWATALRTMR